MISLFLGWKEFVWLQMVGFILLVVGNMIFSEIIVMPFCEVKEDQSLKENTLSEPLIETSNEKSLILK